MRLFVMPHCFVPTKRKKILCPCCAGMLHCCGSRYGVEAPLLLDLLIACSLRPWVARGQLVPATAVDAEARLSTTLSAWEPLKLAHDTAVCAALDCHPDAVLLVEDDGLSPWVVRAGPGPPAACPRLVPCRSHVSMMNLVALQKLLVPGLACVHVNLERGRVPGRCWGPATGAACGHHPLGRYCYLGWGMCLRFPNRPLRPLHMFVCRRILLSSLLLSQRTFPLTSTRRRACCGCVVECVSWT